MEGTHARRPISANDVFASEWQFEIQLAPTLTYKEKEDMKIHQSIARWLLLGMVVL
jgi:hypothetical protein